MEQSDLGPHCLQQDLSPDRIAHLILHILFLEFSKSVTLILILSGAGAGRVGGDCTVQNFGQYVSSIQR